MSTVDLIHKLYLGTWIIFFTCDIYFTNFNLTKTTTDNILLFLVLKFKINSLKIEFKF